MSIGVGDYSFEGPFKFLNIVRDVPGLFAVHYYRDGKYFLLDIGEEEKLRSALEQHARRNEWDRFARGVLTFAVLYTGEHSTEERRAVVAELREQYRPVCGR
jgi:hypothetical protein